MSVENKKLVIFDFDGVLVDTLGIVYTINKEIHQDLSIEEYKSFFEGNINFAVRKDGTKKKSHPNFFDLYDSGSREIIIPGIFKLADMPEFSGLIAPRPLFVESGTKDDIFLPELLHHYPECIRNYGKSYT
ncbi:MAG: hypothetical protein WCG45_06165 [bacterium]